MKEKLRIRNWDRWQSYRRDRGQPPWIKVHREIMRNLEWVAMTDAQRGQLVAIWLLAADHDGVIPASPDLIQKLCFMTEKPDLEFFMDQGFIDRDAIVTSDRRQADANMTHQKRAREAEAEAEADYTSPSGACPTPVGDGPSEEPDDEKTGAKKNPPVPYQRIVDLYHGICCPPLPSVVMLNDSRKASIRARWNGELSSLKDWEDYFEVVRASSFLTGQVEPSGGRAKPFLADIDWLIKPANVVKIMEGKYDD